MKKYNQLNTLRPFDSKITGAAPFHQDKMPLEMSESEESEEMKTKKVPDDAPIQVRNYQNNYKKENLFWIIG